MLPVEREDGTINKMTIVVVPGVDEVVSPPRQDLEPARLEQVMSQLDLVVQVVGRQTLKQTLGGVLII